MSDVLDQSDVDALLNAIGDSDAPQGAEATDVAHAPTSAPGEVFGSHADPTIAVDIHPYDFHHPERVSKDQMRSLEQLHEGFSRNFGASLSGFLRTIIEVQVTTIEQQAYSEFIHGLPNPTSFNLLGCEPLDGQMCLEISPLIIYPIIDRLLGGTNQDLFIPQRPLTLIEQRLVDKITARAIEALEEAWANIVPLKCKLAQTESNPQLIQIVPPNEVVVVVGFELKMDGRAGSMSLCIPFNVIEPVIEKLSSQGWYDSGEQRIGLRDHLAEKLEQAPVETAAVLAETTITVSDLLGMNVGDLIVTEKPATKPVVLSVEGQKKFIANLGQHKGNRALKVLRRMEPKDRF